MMEKISGLVAAAGAELRSKKRALAISLLKDFMLKAERARVEDDTEGLTKAINNQSRLEQMNVRDVMDFEEIK